jgi:Delta carbonic anhydrase
VRSWAVAIVALAAGGGLGNQASADAICQGYGPQTPRDVSSRTGSNARLFAMAPPASQMNLCNIHFHANAEHKAPGFSVFAGEGERGGWRCNETPSLTPAELADPAHGQGACHGVQPGDTIEVHWVHSSCDVAPGEGLASCLAEDCSDPQLRVEAQAFLVVNDPHALSFADFDYAGGASGLHQARALPSGTGDPVVFLGSTTGPSFTQQTCSPLQVTWSVRPACAKIDIGSLNRWCEGNLFHEDHAHGVRQLVTAPDLLAPIE